MARPGRGIPPTRLSGTCCARPAGAGAGVASTDSARTRPVFGASSRHAGATDEVEPSASAAALDATAGVVCRPAANSGPPAPMTPPPAETTVVPGYLRSAGFEMPSPPRSGDAGRGPPPRICSTSKRLIKFLKFSRF